MIDDPLKSQIKRFQKKLVVDASNDGQKLFDFLANAITPTLSKATWKKCIESGGVWLKNPKEKKRLKRVTAIVKTSDIIEVFFDPKAFEKNSEIDSINEPKMILHEKGISVWYKPINMLTQSSPYGDDSSLVTFVTNTIKPSFLIHRLDRETEGLVLFAHDKSNAAKLNDLFSKHLVQKKYFALVVGKEEIVEQKIDLAIDDKAAQTLLEKPSEFELEKLYTKFPETKMLHATWVKLSPITGRKHQLRIHMQSIKRPLLFDPRYSRTHKKGSRLYLIAYSLECLELNLNLKVLPEVWNQIEKSTARP